VLRYAPDESDLLATEQKIAALWQAIERARAAGDWRPRPSRLCDWCNHKALCPEFGGTPPPLSPLPRRLPGPGSPAQPAARPGPIEFPVPPGQPGPARQRQPRSGPPERHVPARQDPRRMLPRAWR
jgi:putative RecB family exonuclease